MERYVDDQQHDHLRLLHVRPKTDDDANRLRQRRTNGSAMTLTSDVFFATDAVLGREPWVTDGILNINRARDE
jgi:hypothetical protein